MTLRTDEDLPRPDGARGGRGDVRQEIVRRAVLERCARSGHAAEVTESAERLADEWKDVPHRLGTV